VALAELSEKQLDQLLFGKAKGVAPVLGWRSYHTLRSKGSEPGFPDRVCVRERVIFVETKGEKTRVTDAQAAWLTALAKAGEEVYLVRPADFEAFATVLQSRVGKVPLIGARWWPTGERFDEREEQAA
jgi:VRR-NUC domain